MGEPGKDIDREYVELLKKRGYIDRLAALESSARRATRLNYLLVLAVLVLSLVVWYQSGKGLIVVGINDVGVPAHLKQVEGPYPTGKQAELFVKEFVTLLDSYTPETFRNNWNKAKTMMTPDLASIFSREIEEGKLADYVVQNNVVQVCNVLKMEVVGAQTRGNRRLYRLSVLVQRDRVMGQTAQSEKVEYLIDLLAVEVTPENPYGYLVDRFSRKPVVGG